MGTEKKAGDLEEIRVLEGISESEEIDRRVEELMAPEEEVNGKKKKKKQMLNEEEELLDELDRSSEDEREQP